MGASGAGKSTLAKCLNRIVPEFEDGDFHGAIRIAGESIEHLRVCESRRRSGWSSRISSRSCSRPTSRMKSRSRWNRSAWTAPRWIGGSCPALEAVGLRGFEHRDPMSLSGGEKQRLAIASVLALRPSVIVLDEPTTDLDPEGRAEVFELIQKLRAQGLSLIVIEHESEELRAADRIIVLREGEIAADGPPAEVFARTELLTACGVRPPGLGHALELLGIEAQPKSVEQAHEAIVQAYPASWQKLRQHRSVARIRRTEDCGNASRPRIYRNRKRELQLCGRSARARFDRSQSRSRRVSRDRRAKRFGQNDAGQAYRRVCSSQLRAASRSTARIARRCVRRRRRAKLRTFSRIPTIRFSPRRSKMKSRSARAISVLPDDEISVDATKRSKRSAFRTSARAIRSCSARASVSAWRLRACSCSGRGC